MFRVRTESGYEDFKSLVEARQFIQYEVPYGEYPILTADGFVHEVWRGTREITEEIVDMAEYRTPLVFLNQLPNTPVTMQIGELNETRNKDGKRLKVSFVTGFTAFSQRDGEVPIMGDATLYWKNDEPEGPALLQALGAAGKSLGDTVSLTRQDKGLFVVGEATEASGNQTGGMAPASAPASAPTAQPQMLNGNPVTPTVIVQGYAYFVGQADAILQGQAALDDSYVKEVTVADVISLAMGMAQKFFDDRTVARPLVENDGDAPF